MVTVTVSLIHNLNTVLVFTPDSSAQRIFFLILEKFWKQGKQPAGRNLTAQCLGQWAHLKIFVKGETVPITIK